MRSHVHTVARPLAQPQVDADLDLAALEVRGDRRLVIAFHREPAPRHLRRPEADRQQVALGGLAGLAHRHDDAAPIGVLAGDRGLHQRRIGDRHADAVRAAVALGAFDGDRDQLLRAFAVAHHQVREIAAQLRQRRAEAIGIGMVGGERRVARLAGGEGEHGVAGRGVAVDGDAREARRIGLAQRRCKEFGAPPPHR